MCLLATLIMKPKMIFYIILALTIFTAFGFFAVHTNFGGCPARLHRPPQALQCRPNGHALLDRDADTHIHPDPDAHHDGNENAYPIYPTYRDANRGWWTATTVNTYTVDTADR
jgi:hypothetical protein